MAAIAGFGKFPLHFLEAKKIRNAETLHLRPKVIQFIQTRFRCLGSAVGIAFANRIRIVILGAGEQDLLLLAPILITRQAGDIWEAPTVADVRRLEHVAVLIHVKSHGVGDARIGTLNAIDWVKLPLVVEGEAFARMREEHGVPIPFSRLQWTYAEIAFGSYVRPRRKHCAIERIRLLPQHRALQRTTGFASFFGCEISGQDRVVEQHLGTFVRLAIIFVRQMARDPAVPDKYAGVIPGFCQRGGNVERSLLVARDGKTAVLG